MNSQKQTQGTGAPPSQSQSAETPQAQAGYGNSQDERGRTEQDETSQPRNAEDQEERNPQAGEAIPGETSRDPAQQARADGNPQLYEG